MILHCPKKKSLEGSGEQSKPYANEKIYLSLTTLQEFRAAFFCCRTAGGGSVLGVPVEPLTM